MQALKGLSKEGVELPQDVVEGATVEPTYFDALAETVARMLRRPRDAQRILRYIEWWGQGQLALGGPPVPMALGPYTANTPGSS